MPGEVRGGRGEVRGSRGKAEEAGEKSREEAGKAGEARERSWEAREAEEAGGARHPRPAGLFKKPSRKPIGGQYDFGLSAWGNQ